MNRRLARWIAAVLATGLIVVVARGGDGPQHGPAVRVTAPVVAAHSTTAGARPRAPEPTVTTEPVSPSTTTTTVVHEPISLDPQAVQPISFAVDAPPEPPDARPVPAVALYGDSLTVAAWDHYEELTAGAVDTDGHRWDGTAITDWRNDILADTHDRLVLALGTNDAERDGAPPWADVLNRLPATTCIVWPKPYEGSNAVRLFNAQMTAIVAAHANVHVIDWDSTVKQHPEWVHPDHKHYTPAGSDQYASMLRDAALTCP